ncbi:MAG: hypothetical protein N4A45_06755 [Flavobacteriales bacterium]|jgi:predicted nucleic acid-binding Zn ribbon protein|nr:hypothetical protein [Flavobacteriales bacterium]
MKKSILKIAGILSIAFLMTSCQESCEKCSAKVVQYLNGEQVSTSTVSAQEICGDELDKIKDNPVVTVEQGVGELKQKVVTTYTCN